MGEVITKTNIPREKGWLYYASTDEQGNITICRAKMSRGKGKKKENAS